MGRGRWRHQKREWPMAESRPVRHRRRFKRAAGALLAVVAGVGLILLLRFLYPDRVCIRWQSWMFEGVDGSRWSLFCAEYGERSRLPPQGH